MANKPLSSGRKWFLKCDFTQTPSICTNTPIWLILKFGGMSVYTLQSKRLKNRPSGIFCHWEANCEQHQHSTNSSYCNGSCMFLLIHLCHRFAASRANLVLPKRGVVESGKNQLRGHSMARWRVTHGLRKAGLEIACTQASN